MENEKLSGVGGKKKHLQRLTFLLHLPLRLRMRAFSTQSFWLASDHSNYSLPLLLRDLCRDSIVHLSRASQPSLPSIANTTRVMIFDILTGDFLVGPIAISSRSIAPTPIRSAIC